MLDNEPQFENDNGTTEQAEVTPPETAPPARRTRAPRRKAVPPVDAPGAEPGADIEAAASSDAAAHVDATGPAEPAPAPRRRRKAAAPAASAPAGPDPDAGPAAAAAGFDPTAGVATGPADAAAAPVKATRSRRKKAAPPVSDAPVSEAPVSEAPASDRPVVEDAVVEEIAAEIAEALDETPADAPTLIGVIPLDEPLIENEPAAAGGRRAPLPPPVLFMPPEPEPAADLTPPARRSRRAKAAAAVAEPTSGGPATSGPATTEPATTGSAPTGRATRGSSATGSSTTGSPATGSSATGAETEAAVVEATTAPFDAGTADEPAETGRRSRRRRRGAPVEEIADEPVVVVDETGEPAEDPEDEIDDENSDDDSDTDAAGRRRRRRGRRGRGRGKGPADEGDEDEPVAADSGETDDEESEESDDSDGDGDGDGVTRRRRRRRRKGSGDAEVGGIEDGVHTVVRVREPRRTDEVQGVSGSTRLEAKRQRRRDGREQRRTRPPILSESEFLARREAVDREMVVRQKPDRIQIAVLEDGILVEHYVSRVSSGTMVGNVYLGKVQNVLPSMEAAFVDIGRGRNAVLYAGEVNWDATGLEGRSRSIEQALHSGDSVLVQVTKDPIGHKGARLSSHIALSGRHLVYVPNGNASGISRKLPDTERKRLRDVLKKLVPDGAGVIVRTAAEGASEDELARDVKRLQAQWEDIQAKAAEGHAPAALSEEPDLVIRVVRDLFNEDFRELVVQGDQVYSDVENYLNSVSPDLVERLHRYTGTHDVFADKRIDEQILKGLDRKVFLPSGGHLVIDRTEAMTVVDVNTGKYTGAGGNLEETVTRNNLEAAEEIVRQLRLRDLGGIVVIDFIDMVLESNRELVLRRLTECLGRDRTKHQVTEITSLGLVQMTRKRIGSGLLEAFSETCDHCKGRGVLIHTEPVPEKRTAGAVNQVKAVAAAAAAPARSSRRGRRGGGGDVAPIEAVPVIDVVEAIEVPEIEVPGVVVPEVVVVETDDPVAETAGLPPAAVPGSGIVAPTLPGVNTSDADDDYDISGYDLSRYETPDEDDDEPLQLVGADDPDAADDEDDDEVAGTGPGGRRRSRRGATRRRTRP